MLQDSSFDIKVQSNNFDKYYDECIMKYLEQAQKSSININNRSWEMVALSLSYFELINKQPHCCEVA